ncbi:MAG: 50S ribosomal protein L30 [Candidatus Heimdallarchaeaceae archaeon]
MSEKQDTQELLAVIRIRGRINVFFKVQETLNMLNIRKTNYMSLFPKTPSTLGMLKRAKDHVTWGEINQEALEHVLRRRGEIEGKIRLTDNIVKENTEYPTIKSLSKALFKGETIIQKLPKLKKFFRLHPARKGYKSVKRNFADGGDLGYRGSAINELIVRMA